MAAAVHAKKLGWISLRSDADADDRLDAGQLDELIQRAERQEVRLEQLRLAAAHRVHPVAERPQPLLATVGVTDNRSRPAASPGAGTVEGVGAGRCPRGY